jgi:hypothetical protein
MMLYGHPVWVVPILQPRLLRGDVMQDAPKQHVCHQSVPAPYY